MSAFAASRPALAPAPATADTHEDGSAVEAVGNPGDGEAHRPDHKADLHGQRQPGGLRGAEVPQVAQLRCHGRRREPHRERQ